MQNANGFYIDYSRPEVHVDEFGKITIIQKSGAYSDPFAIDRVLVHGPATIIFWKDGTKTVVKHQLIDGASGDDKWCDREKAITMCFAKKALGNKGNYYNHIRKAIEKVEEVE